MSRRFVACLLGLFALAWTVGAWAGTATIDTTLITRSNSNHPGQTNPNWISRADCLGDDAFTFSLSTSFTSGEVLQGWVGPNGADCHTQTSRTGTSATCRKVYENAGPAQPGMSVTLRDQDMLAAAISGGSSTSTTLTLPATSAICEPTSGASTTPVGLTVFFLFITNGSVADVPPVTGDNTGTAAISYDLVGPSAPASVGAGVGDTLLKVSWGATSDTTLAGYYVFCATGSFNQLYVGDSGYTCVEAGTSDAATTPIADTGTPIDETSTALDASDDVVDASDTEASAEASTAPPATSAAQPQQSSSGGGCPTGTVAVVPSTCDPTGLLVGGVIPSATLLSSYLCGQASDPMAVDATVSSLTNNQTYAVAVAAYDQLGNVGPLSNVACQTPQKILGFYDTYTAAGGTAGGSSFCAVGAPGSKAALTMAGLLALAAAALVVRRRRP